MLGFWTLISCDGGDFGVVERTLINAHIEQLTLEKQGVSGAGTDAVFLRRDRALGVAVSCGERAIDKDLGAAGVEAERDVLPLPKLSGNACVPEFVIENHANFSPGQAPAAAEFSWLIRVDHALDEIRFI